MVGGQVSYRPLRCNSLGVQMYRISIYNKIRCTVKAQLLLGKNESCAFIFTHKTFQKENSPNLIVAPVTSNTAKKPDHQAHVLVDGNRAFLQPSMILAESVQTISKGRLIRPMGRLSIPELIRLNYALLYQLDLNEWVWRKEAYERYLRYHR